MDRGVRRDRGAAWLRSRPGLVDTALAAVVTWLTVLLSSGSTPEQLLVSIALTVPLAWRRRAPVAAAVAVTAAGVAELVLVDVFLAANVAAPASVYALAAYGPRWAGRAGLATGLVAAGLAAARYYASPADPQTLLIATVGISVVVVASWALGDVRRAGIRQLHDLRDRALLLEVERDQESRLATYTERARIAREMHDVVAHSLSVVIAQADGGRYAGRTDPEAATSALAAIGDTGRQALSDMRALLGVLRTDGVREDLPQPDVAAVPSLVADVRASGLDVDLLVAGAPRPLPAGRELAVYRIVQESLTNVLKHAGPAARAWVRLQWRDDALEVSVLDDGRGAGAATGAAAGAAAGGGQGLTGMRERAELHGGVLDAGPNVGGGFEVRASMPYRPDSARASSPRPTARR